MSKIFNNRIEIKTKIINYLLYTKFSVFTKMRLNHLKKIPIISSYFYRNVI